MSDVIREIARSPNVSRHRLADRMATGESRLNKYLDILIKYGVVIDSAHKLRITYPDYLHVERLASNIVRDRLGERQEASRKRRENAHSLRLRTREGRRAYSDFRRYYTIKRNRLIQQIKARKTRQLRKAMESAKYRPDGWISGQVRSIRSETRREIQAARRHCITQKRWAKAQLAEVEKFDRRFTLLLATAEEKGAGWARRRLLRECVALRRRISESNVLKRWTEVREYLDAHEEELERRRPASPREIAAFLSHPLEVEDLLSGS
ncbi:MAG: hypothetical protein JRM99_03195 [Nitrososphaerota archaeon]|nr:hypothetical protein [Nitrososphaerota archaeon]MDG6990411.1 hypothetical protein [Nitrososphaerota archaeon]